MGLPIFLVDAFTDKPFAGNPAAVCLLPEPHAELWMQHVAQEINQSETAFLCRQSDSFELRWFTPTVEIDMCGHATLASAHVLWEEAHLEPTEQARFDTRSGLLIAERKDDWIELDFPEDPEEQVVPPSDLAIALGVTPNYVGKNRFDYLVEVSSEDIVQSMNPDLSLLVTLPADGVIVTSPADSPEYDFVSRYFAPRIGINEDPVCGAAHCCLGPFWRNRLGKNEFVAYQASSRGGIVRVRLSGNRVYLKGKAVTVLRGELLSV
jgi:PhzF family phenazine biosynthesis protein